MTSYAELLRSRTLAEQVVERLGLAISPAKLAKRIRSKVVPDTRIIDVTVTYPDADKAALIANTLASTFVDVQQEFGGRAGVNATVFEPAVRPLTATSPRPVRDGVLGAILGLMLGIAVAFIRSQLDTKLRTREQVEEALKIPVLAEIPAAQTPERERRLFLNVDPRSRQAEAFRMLRTNIQFVSVDRPVYRVIVTSPYPGDGKTTVAANLAASMAAGGFNTVLLDADLRRPTAHEYFGLDSSPGLTDVLLNRVALATATRETSSENLRFIASGPLPPNPAELLGGFRMVEMLESLSATTDIVICDTPPVLPVTDAAVLAGRADGVIFVLRAGRATREHAREAISQFERLGVRILGIVLNGVGDGGPESYYNYNYNYRSYEGREPEITLAEDAPVISPHAPAGESVDAILATLRGKSAREQGPSTEPVVAVDTENGSSTRWEPSASDSTAFEAAEGDFYTSPAGADESFEDYVAALKEQPSWAPEADLPPWSRERSAGDEERRDTDT